MGRLIATALLASVASIASTREPIRVLIVDGVNNHDWASTTAATRGTLEATGRFTVDVATSPSRHASKDEWDAWRPRFFDYQAVLSNFNDDCASGDCEPRWSDRMRADFEQFVREGGGFVPVHAADNAWAGWAEYNDMIGLGGWGGRKAGKAGWLLRQSDGQWAPTSPDAGRSGDHGAMREFQVIHDMPSHPILAGLPTAWMHATDELYCSLRGPARNVEVLAHSYSLLTEENEPILMLITYGKGKVFHIPLGHYSGGVALHCVGFQTVLARGVEYVATGKVTIGIPRAFPTRDAASVIPPSRVTWPHVPRLGRLDADRDAEDGDDE